VDGLELARQAAAHRHRAVAAEASEGLGPYDLAKAAASRERLAVRRVKAGNPLLHGGEATYDPDTRLILHQACADPFEEAFLVAHELGHVVLEDGAGRHVASGVDPMRGSEPPSGTDAVLDYGRRQRREVMMDLFARELLLPREVARDLHLRGCMPAKAIAARLGLPWNVVALQLLDALLLPPPRGAVAATPEPLLNSEQLDAATHSGSPLLLEAGPGTGKTRTLVARVAWLVEGGADPASILVLTFSNAAAADLAERIAVRCPGAAQSVWVGTFHSFGLDLLHRFHEREGLPPNPRLLDRVEAIELLEDVFPRLNLSIYRDLYDPSGHIDTILDAISRANDEVVDAERYAELAAAMLASATTEEKRNAARRCAEVSVVFRAYEALKRERSCLDFGDLVARPVRLLEQNSDALAALRGTYRHVLVDEFQDVNRASVRLLKLLTDDGANLWAVGDVRQSIYRFRGASSFNVARFGAADFPGGQRKRLRVNYRSRKEIVETFAHFASAGMKAAPAGEVSFEAFRGPLGHPVEYRGAPHKDGETLAVAEAIRELHAAGVPYGGQAVLCTSNERMAEIGAALESLGVPVLHLGKLFERAEVKDLLCLLSLLTDRRAAGLLRTATMPAFRMPLGDVAAAIAHLAETGAAALAWRDIGVTIPGMSAEGRQGLERVSAAFSGLKPDASPWDVFAGLLLDHTRIAADLAVSTETVDRIRGVAVWQLLHFARAQPAGRGLPAQRFLSRIRRLLLLSEDRELRRLPAAAAGIDAVRIMTIHGSKGLEFPVVHLPGLSADTIPKRFRADGCLPPDGMIEGTAASGEEAMREGHDEEQECLLFVALSRARDRLILYSPLRKANGARRQRSAFLDRLGKALASREVIPTLTLPPRPADAALPANVEVPSSFRPSDLDLYDTCPRRFLYTTVLRTGGRQAEAAFRQMHAAVQEVVSWLGSDHRLDPTPGEVQARLDAAWAQHGPHDHGYSRDYMAVASGLLAQLVSFRRGRTLLPAAELRFEVEGGEVVVRPDEVAEEQPGGLTLRRIRTGHSRASDAGKLSAVAFRIAAAAAHPGCTVELVHLADPAVTPLLLDEKGLAKGRAAVANAIAAIRAGEFGRKPSPWCPGCPSFFHCGHLPDPSA
jgi:superfamily I DNA/RNA helicase/Zn-dependent peptidase ImmA (M78 family)